LSFLSSPRARLRRSAAARCAVPALAALALLSCKSAEEKCAEARAAATTAWSAYIDPLETEHAAAHVTIKSAHTTLKASVEPRLGEAANTIADQRYIPGTEGWSRGRAVVFDDLCRKDSECAKLKHGIHDAENTIKDHDERLGPARAARKALAGSASGAKAAADAAIIDPERPALKLAQAASAEAELACEGVVTPAQARE
jgi:hypothetical protein